MAETMAKIIISGNLSSYKIVMLDKYGNIQDVIFGGESSKSIKANIYLAKVSKVEPSLQAAFVEYNDEKFGFLPFPEIHPDYYNNNKNLYDVLSNFNTKESNNAACENKKEILDIDENDESLNSIDKIEFTVSNEYAEEKKEVIIQQERKKFFIQDVIKAGQYILVQVFRDERGNKGASLTSYITFPTKYCVFTPNNRRLHGVSKRIPDQKERQRLRNAIDKFNIKGDFGLVVRTAACEVLEEDLKRDYENAVSLWNKIAEKTKVNKIGIINQAESGIIQSIRDVATKNAKIITDNQEIAELVANLSDVMNIKKEHIMVHRSHDLTLFDKFKITEKLNDLYKDRVNLPSGGYLIINYTEALVAIDVNSGRLVNEKDIENTAFKTNIEAAVEVANQLRLRDIGGLIVVDFIDMEDVNNRKKIETKMKEVISLEDRARVQFTTISHFGLMEISRQRLRTGFMESSTIKCEKCSGTGRMFMAEMVLEEIFQCISSNVLKRKFTRLTVDTSFAVESRFSSYNQSQILDLCKKHNIQFSIKSSADVQLDSFILTGISKETGENIDITKFSGLSKIDDSHGGINGWVGGRDVKNIPSPINKNKKNKNKGFVESMISKFLSIFKGKKHYNNKKPFNQGKGSYNNKNKTYDNKNFGAKKHYNKGKRY